MSLQQDVSISQPLDSLSSQARSELFEFMTNSGSCQKYDEQAQVPPSTCAGTMNYSEETPWSYLPYLLPSEDSPPLFTSSNKRLRSGNFIPRPANCFILFRRHVGKILRFLEHDHRLLSRSAGYCWNLLPKSGKDAWRHKAEEAKIAHKIANPEYVYAPSSRRKRPMKRKVKRNGEKDLKRCRQVATLLLHGKMGSELHQAVESFDASLAQRGSSVSEPADCNNDLLMKQNGSPTTQSQPLLSTADFQENYLAHESTPRPECSHDSTHNTVPFHAGDWFERDLCLANVKDQQYYPQRFPQFQNPAMWAPHQFSNDQSYYIEPYINENHCDAGYESVTDITLDGTFQHFSCDQTCIPQQDSIQTIWDAPQWIAQEQYTGQPYIPSYY